MPSPALNIVTSKPWRVLDVVLCSNGRIMKLDRDRIGRDSEALLGGRRPRAARDVRNLDSPLLFNGTLLVNDYGAHKKVAKGGQKREDIPSRVTQS